MRHRIYVDAPLIETVTITGDELHHAARVVRVREGEEVELFDGRGHAASARVETLSRDQLIVRITGELPSREARSRIRLAMSIIQLEKFELVLQKGTELGVASFVPLVTDRIEVREERYRGKTDRWEKIVFEAVKQSGRAMIPPIEKPQTVEEAWSDVNVVFDADETPGTWQPGTPATLFIGPEGGWSERELQFMREHNALFHRLGERRLRAETAAIVAAAIVAARFGDI